MDDFQKVVRRATARVQEMREQLIREDLTPDAGKLAWICYGITRVSIDPGGYLRTKLHADEPEIRHTACLYAAIDEGFAAYVSGLLDITQELADTEAFQSVSAGEVESIQQRLADEGHAPDGWLYWCLAHSYVCGMFAPEFPADLLEAFPTTARRYQELLGHQAPGQAPQVVAMQLALEDCLMCPMDEGWRDLVTRN